jgi:hypothetical protein
MIAGELHKSRCKYEGVASDTKDLSLAAKQITSYGWLPGRNWISDDKKSYSISM